MIDRRAFLFGTTTLLGVCHAGPVCAAESTGTRLILLGTAGGPRPRRSRYAPSQVVVVNGAAYVFDCGEGVARQLALAKIPLSSVKHLFITHHHSDHTADYGNLLSSVWVSGLTTPIDSWGPPPLIRMTQAYFVMNEADISTRIADEGRVPLQQLVRPHDIDRGGMVMQDGNVTVSTAIVHHPPVTPALAFRIDTPDKSIVFSGDTTPSDNLVALAEGADILVHEAYLPDYVDQMIGSLPNAKALKASILSHHTSAEQAGQIAQRANVQTLVLSHLIPPEDPTVPDDLWITAAQKHYQGRIVVGKDLLEL